MSSPSSLAERLSSRALLVACSKGARTVSNSLLALIGLTIFVAIYANLFNRRLGGVPGYGVHMVTILVALCVRLLHCLGLLVLGMSAFGNTFARHPVLLIDLVTTGLMAFFFVYVFLTRLDVIAGSIEGGLIDDSDQPQLPFVVWLFPGVVTLQALLASSVDAALSQFAAVHDKLLNSGNGLCSADVIRVLEAKLESSAEERSKCVHLARIVGTIQPSSVVVSSPVLPRDAVSTPSVDPLGRRWGSDDLRRFLSEAEVVLENRSLLTVLMKHLGTEHAAAEAQYGFVATVCSGLRYLAVGSPRYFCLFVLLNLIDAGIAPGKAFSTSRITDAIVVQDRQALPVEVSVFLGIHVLEVFISYLMVCVLAELEAKALVMLLARLMQRMVHVTSIDRLVYTDGALTTLFTSDVPRMQQLWIGLLWNLIYQLPKIVGTIIYTFVDCPPIGSLMLAFIPLILYVGVSVPQGASTRAAQAESGARKEVISAYTNGIACQRMIWSVDGQEEWQRSVDPSLLAQRDTLGKARYYGNGGQQFLRALVNAFAAVHICLLAAIAIYTDESSVSRFTALTLLFSNACASITNLGSLFRAGTAAQGSAQQLELFLTLPAASSNTTTKPHQHAALQDEDPAMASHANHGLTMSNVDFGYPGTAVAIFKGISLHVPCGNCVAIVGDSGSGKSTLLSMLLTWYNASCGRIQLGDVSFDASDITATESAQRSLRGQIACVFQDTMLLRASVHDNIAFGAAKATRTDVEWAAGAAGCDDFIRTKLARGYETMLGGVAGSSNLSGGQAQRICIARALCRKPKLLLLDEATSALDPEIEEEIFSTIVRLRSDHPHEFESLIVVSITHHPNTLKYADRVIRVKTGTLADEPH